jgi:ABC-type Fe3+-siderophore transport system permease subunit
MFGSFFLLMALVLQALAGKKMVDERAIRISAKANQWGILSLLIYCISVALLAKHDPGITSVPIALMGAVFVFFIPSFIAFQILKSMPNAEVDKWETK